MSQGKDGAVQESSQVTAELQEMDTAHNELHKAILALEDRLLPVLLGEINAKPKDVASPDLVPLASTLWNKNGFLRGLLARVNNLRGRIEL